jgi:hypothetical protein
MKTPCELVVWHLLPAIRSELAKELKTEKFRFKQTEIAGKLGITPSAVSQYMSKKRGQDIEFPAHIKEMIAAIAKRIFEEDLSGFEIMGEVCVICLEARKLKILCEIHRSVDANIPDKCGYWGKIENCMECK